MKPVILSGGSGTRLWPLSRPERPKQLQRLVDHQTLLQATALRTAGMAATEPATVVCNAAQVEPVLAQLDEIGCSPEAVLVEPVGRNTAPAIAAAALSCPPDTVLAVFPADHVIADVDAFRAALVEAEAAAVDGAIVTFGIVPSRPDTGFGYLHVLPGPGPLVPLERFVEKPDADTAARYVASGEYLWNSGMFVFAAGVILDRLERHAPGVVAATRAALASATGTANVVELGPEFAGGPSVSIDYAVMEHVGDGLVVPLDAGWSDVGSWQALWEVVSPEGGTFTAGQVYAAKTARSYIRAESRPVAVIGVDDLVVVETPDAVLVVHRHHAQDVRAAAEWFAERHRDG